MKKLYCILIALLVFACVQQEEPPENLISKDQMIKILIDIHIAEAIVNIMNVSKDSSMVMFNGLEQKIFDKYRMDKEQFHDSYNYYLHNINILDDIYTVVVDSLSMREALFRMEMMERKHKTNN